MSLHTHEMHTLCNEGDAIWKWQRLLYDSMLAIYLCLYEEE